MPRTRGFTWLLRHHCYNLLSCVLVMPFFTVLLMLWSRCIALTNKFTKTFSYCFANAFKWSHNIALMNKFAKILLQSDSLDVDGAYQDFFNIIKKAAKKTIPRGYQNNYILCWDAECESRDLFTQT